MIYAGGPIYMHLYCNAVGGPTNLNLTRGAVIAQCGGGGGV